MYAGDSAELVTAAYTWGIAHPPGYPLYTFFGAALSHVLSIQTIAWRVGLLSSIPMAVSGVLIYKILRKFFVSIPISVITSCLFASLYPVWLYAIVPEVFGFYTFFITALTYLAVVLWKDKKNWLIFLFSFLVGLSLTHHHVIIFVLFPLLWGLYPKIKILTVMKKWQCIGMFLLGFSFYLYAPIASSYYPALDPEHSASFDGFFRLITRAQYGTFRASYGTGNLFLFRILNVVTLLQFLVKDFGILLVSGLIGICSFWKKGVFIRKIIIFPFFLYIFYFFYAAFPVQSNFSLGTLERFIIAPYVFMALFVGLGIDTIVHFTERIWKKFARRIRYALVAVLFMLIYLTFPIQALKKYYVPMLYLSQDTTFEKLGMDILRILPKDAIFSASSDTGGFSTLFAYHVLGYRKNDSIYLFYSQLHRSYYQTFINKTYPNIIPPKNKQTVAESIRDFIKTNGKIFPVFDEIVQVYHPGYWVPMGMLVQYFENDTDLPPKEQTIQQNQTFWNTTYDPNTGALLKFRHMLLSDVMRHYAHKRIIFGDYLWLYELYEDAENQYTRAYSSDRTNILANISMLKNYLRTNQCEESKPYLQVLLTSDFSANTVISIIGDYIRLCPKEFEDHRELFNNYLLYIEKTKDTLY